MNTITKDYYFRSRTYLVIICVAAFWILNIFFYSDQLANTKTQLALDVIKASLGKYVVLYCST